MQAQKNIKGIEATLLNDMAEIMKRVEKNLR